MAHEATEGRLRFIHCKVFLYFEIKRAMRLEVLVGVHQQLTLENFQIYAEPRVIDFLYREPTGIVQSVFQAEFNH